MTKTEYDRATAYAAELRPKVARSKSIKRQLLRALCKHLGRKADSFQLVPDSSLPTLMSYAISYKAFGSLTDKQEVVARRILSK